MVKLAVEYVVLTGCRSGEARNATWDEIDGNTWTSPGERTKTGKPHRIPLSGRAQAVLDEARRLADDTRLIFGAPRTGNPLSDNTLSKALRTADIPVTVHGFRASLKDWLAAEGVPYELAEAVLAHQPRGIAKSYRRDDLLEARRPIMERWAQHVARRVSISQRESHNPRPVRNPATRAKPGTRGADTGYLQWTFKAIETAI